jgi:hypothetical protein
MTEAGKVDTPVLVAAIPLSWNIGVANPGSIGTSEARPVLGMADARRTHEQEKANDQLD